MLKDLIMKPQAQFGRRATPPQAGARVRPDLRVATPVELTQAQRALLFAADDEAGAPAISAAPGPAPWSRGAGLIACAAVSAVAVALTLNLQRQGAEPAGLDATSLAATGLAATGLAATGATVFGATGPGALAWLLFSVASNIGTSCWLTHKFCGWRGLGDFVAYGIVGACISAALSYLSAFLGLGESDLGYAADAVTGGVAALLYLLLAGRPGQRNPQRAAI